MQKTTLSDELKEAENVKMLLDDKHLKIAHDASAALKELSSYLKGHVMAYENVAALHESGKEYNYLTAESERLKSLAVRLSDAESLLEELHFYAHAPR